MTSKKKRWTPEDDAELLDVVNVFLGDGGLIKDAFGYYADSYDRTYEATRRRYFDIKGEDAPDLRLKGKEPQQSKTAKEIKPFAHSALSDISNYIDELEQANEILKHQVSTLDERNVKLNTRIVELEKCESELTHLLTIINRSRKEAFAGDTNDSRPFKIVDGVPVFK
jgi:hypothetical protein